MFIIYLIYNLNGLIKGKESQYKEFTYLEYDRKDSKSALSLT